MWPFRRCNPEPLPSYAERLDRLAAIAAVSHANTSPEVQSLRGALGQANERVNAGRAAIAELTLALAERDKRIAELTDAVEAAVRRELFHE